MTQVCPKFGWYGKVPCVGDFVRASLSPQFVTTWDSWMQALLTAGREELGDRWQACYLGAPIWRFALSAGMCGPRTVAGIVMPSVDRVGRQFPLCLAVEFDASAWSAFQTLEPIFAPLEEAALSMLEDSASLADLEQALTQLPPPRAATHPRASRLGSATALLVEGTPAHALSALAAEDPRTLWVTLYDGTNRMLLTPQMPAGPEAASALFDLEAPVWGSHERYT